MKKILYIADYLTYDWIDELKVPYSPAGKNKIENIIKSLTKAGFKVDLFSTISTRDWKIRKAKIEYPQKDVRIIRQKIRGFPIIRKFFSLTQFLLFLLKARKNKEYDIILFYNFDASCPYALLAKLILNKPTYIEYEDGLFTGFGISRFKKYLSILIEKVFLNLRLLHGGILVNSNFIERTKLKNYVICHGFFRELDLTKEGSNKIPTLFFEDMFEKEKGFDILLKAIPHIKSKAHITVFGFGSLLKEAKNLESELKNNKNIIFEVNKEVNKDWGNLPQSEKHEKGYEYRITNSDILLNLQTTLHKFYDYSFPFKISNYLSTPNIIITTANSDLEKLNQKLGNPMIIFDASNPRDLAKKIDVVIKNLRKYKEISKTNPEKYKKIAHYKIFSEKFKKLFENSTCS